MLECVVNISEGRRADLIGRIADAAAGDLLDVHSDGDHNRSVLTLAGEQAPRAVAAATVATLDITVHVGVHPRFGVLDVVPFVPLGGSTMAQALAARDRFSAWAGMELALPCFHYGPERSLPDLRREAFATIFPDAGPSRPHPTAGAVAVGARPVLVAYNLWLAEPDLERATRVASAIRGPAVRSLAFAVGDAVQVSMNLIDPSVIGPAQVYDQVADMAAIERAEVVGLVPRSLLDSIDPARWANLDLSPDRTIESRSPRS